MALSRAQFFDALLEPRLPHHLPWWLVRLARFGRGSASLSSSDIVPVAITIDVEQDLGSGGAPDQWSACEPFLDWFAETATSLGWRATLFVQGSLVLPLAPRLRQLSEAHEIGLHGYAHELWGRPLWFGHQAMTPPAERRELLDRGYAAFDRAGLPQPISFRAPNLVSDDTTLALLMERGLRIDSSGAAFRGCLPILSRHGSLLRIPVSADPRPKIRRRAGVPTWARFDHLNAATLLFSPMEVVWELVRAIFGAQDRLGAPRHLVLLAHPWEFADNGVAGCSTANRQLLVERIAALSAQLRCEFRPLARVLPGTSPAPGV